MEIGGAGVTDEASCHPKFQPNPMHGGHSHMGFNVHVPQNIVQISPEFIKLKLYNVMCLVMIHAKSQGSSSHV